MKAVTQHQIQLGARRVDYRVVRSKMARKLRIRVGLNGIEVVQPTERSADEVSEFLGANGAWILAQLKRLERLSGLSSKRRAVGRILFQGQFTPVRVEEVRTKARTNAIVLIDGEIVIRRSSRSRVPPAWSLEKWLRKQARAQIEQHLGQLSRRFRHTPGKVYVMDQRTKWANCSAKNNLSFSWRLVMAPVEVFRYMVVHEMVHLAIPDHSRQFWLAVKSHCPEEWRARTWLRGNEMALRSDLQEVVGPPLSACVTPGR